MNGKWKWNDIKCRLSLCFCFCAITKGLKTQLKNMEDSCRIVLPWKVK